MSGVYWTNSNYNVNMRVPAGFKDLGPVGQTLRQEIEAVGRCTMQKSARIVICYSDISGFTLRSWHRDDFPSLFKSITAELSGAVEVVANPCVGKYQKFTVHRKNTVIEYFVGIIVSLRGDFIMVVDLI